MKMKKIAMGLVMALVAASCLFAPISQAASRPPRRCCFLGNSVQENVVTNNLPTNTITVHAWLSGKEKDAVLVRGRHLWLYNLEGEHPMCIQINGVPWAPLWRDDGESDDFVMKDPPRSLPMNSMRRGFLSISVAQTNVVATVRDYPREYNEWILTVELDNSKSDKATWVDLTISWKKENPEPTNLSRYVVPATDPSSTPAGFR